MKHVIPKVRSALYGAAKLLGDLSAITSGNPVVMARRLLRRFVAKTAFRATNKTVDTLIPRPKK